MAGYFRKGAFHARRRHRPAAGISNRRQARYLLQMSAAEAEIISILRADRRRWHLLATVAALDLPDCWIGAGFIRNAVWDHLHQYPPSAPNGDIDVIWYDPDRTDPALDRHHEDRLAAIEPSALWSVKNQARMHIRNGDPPYASAIDAMRHWPETATAVAARHHGAGLCEVAAPLGTDDLFGLILRPAANFVDLKRDVYDERRRSKKWLELWPLLREA